LPEWPPANFGYKENLESLGYREIAFDKFKMETDVVKDLKKCFSL